jgi:hypothetical protein
MEIKGEFFDEYTFKTDKFLNNNNNQKQNMFS